MIEKIILVDKKDKKIGEKEKLSAHLEGKLHRAVSVFIFNRKGELLIQKRAKNKYHSPGLWTNTCCTHPRFGEKAVSAAKRRLKEELGIETSLKKLFKIHYKAEVDSLIENEIDHVFVGFFEGQPVLNKKEVESYKWILTRELLNDMRKNPDRFTVWFKIILPKVLTKIK